MVKCRSKKNRSRKENVRDEQKTVVSRELLTFSFRHLDDTQPDDLTGTLISWEKNNLLISLLEKLRQLSGLTRDEAVNQQQIKIYGEFPPKDKTDFFHPKFVEDNVNWSVIKGIGGQVHTVVGYVVESTFYIVFLDMKHRFWISNKKGT